MKAYVIATVRNVEEKVIGYYLLDTDDNNKIVRVSKESLLSVLKRGDLKLKNAKLNGEKIQGIYYSIEKLTYVVAKGNRLLLNDNGWLVLCRNADFSYNIVRMHYTNRKIDVTVQKVGKQDVSSLIYGRHRGSLINYDYEHQRFLIPSDSEFDTQGNKDQMQLSDDEIKRLESEARDPSVCWEFEDFDKYMRYHGWAYKIYKNAIGGRYKSDGSIVETYSIGFISKDCKVVHLPCGTKNIDPLFESSGIDVDTLIINRDIVYIKKLYPEQEVKTGFDITKDLDADNEYTMRIKNFYIQDKKASWIYDYGIVSDLSLYPFQNCAFGTVKICNRKISGFGNNCQFDNLQLFDGESGPRTIDFSFNNSIFKQDRLLMHCARLNFSFQHIKGIKHVVIGNEVHRIGDCFSHIKALPGEFELDLSDAKHLEILGLSNNTGITKLDFSACKEMTAIGSLFGLENLHELKGLDQLHRLNACGGDEGFLPDSYIDRIKFNSSIRHIYYPVSSNDNIEIIMDKDIKYLYGTFYHSYKPNTSHIIYEAPSYGIRSDFFTNMPDISDITQLGIDPSKVNYLESNSFHGWRSLEVFDSRRFEKVAIIPTLAFQSCSKLRTVILDTNIRRLCGTEIFRGCQSLRDLIVSGSLVEIDKAAFKNLNNELRLQVYVIKDTEAHKFFKNKKALCDCHVVDSVEEARRLVAQNNATKENDTDVSRYIYILNNNGKDNGEFLDPKYVDNVDFVYNFYSKLLNKALPALNNLNETKFISRPLSDFKSIGDKIEVIRQSDAYNADDLGHIKNDRAFIGLCNLYTKILDLDERLLHNSVIDMLNMSSPLSLNSISYIDDEKFIGTFTFNTFSNIKMTILFIIINNVVKFIANVNTQYYIKMEKSGHLNMNSAYEFPLLLFPASYKEDRRNITRYNKTFRTLTHFLSAGDLLVYKNSNIDTVISNVKIPKIQKTNTTYAELQDLVQIFFNSNCLLSLNVDLIDIKKSMKASFYDPMTERITLCELSSSSKISAINMHSVNVKIEDVSSLEDIGALDNEYRAMVDKFVTVNGNINALLDKVIMSKEEQEALYNNPNNYDKNNSKLLKAGRNVHKSMKSGTTINSIPIGIIAAVLKDSSLYKPDMMSLRAIEKLRENGDYKFVTTYSRGGYIVHEYEATDKVRRTEAGRFKQYMIYAAKMGTSMARKSSIFYSIYSLENNIDYLDLIGGYMEMYETSVQPANMNKPEFEVKPLGKVGTNAIEGNGNGQFLTYWKKSITHERDYLSNRVYYWFADLRVDLVNGDIYLCVSEESRNGTHIDTIEETLFIPLLRFTDMQNAQKFFDEIIYQSKPDYTALSTTTLVSTCKKYGIYGPSFDGYDLSADSSTVAQLHNLTINGLPNGMPFIVKETAREYVDILAKQPRKA